MQLNEIVEVILELVRFCAPVAFVINFTGWGIRVIIGAATGKGVQL